MRLYELADRYLQIAELAFEECDDDGAIDAELARMLSQIQCDIDSKLAAICRVVRDLELSAEMAKAEAARLSLKRQRAERHAERLKDYMKATLEELGEKKRKVDPIFTVSVQNNPPAVKVTDFDAVPHDFDKELPRQIDLQRIKDILKNGDPVVGCELVQGTHLRIR
jgi:phage host-nuclease inhibitor protein Gam